MVLERVLVDSRVAGPYSVAGEVLRPPYHVLWSVSPSVELEDDRGQPSGGI